MDWSYAAEGGKNVIFQYVGSPECSVYSRHVLRVVKRELAAAAAATIDNDSENNVVGFLAGCNNTPPLMIECAQELQQQQQQEKASQTFQRRIVQPILGRCYIDLAKTVHLPTAMAAQLYHCAMTSGFIPPSRLTDWQIENNSSCSNSSFNNDSGGGDDGVVLASLLRDYKQLSPPPYLKHDKNDSSSSSSSATNKNNITISVEIKPKAGYITTSPLIHPNNRCKYKYTRYALQQQLMHCGHVTKGWQTKQNGDNSTKATATTAKATLFTPSTYSPLDLFSGNTTRIQQAITNLCANMQNNLRIFVNGKQILLAAPEGEEEKGGHDDHGQLLSDSSDYYDTIMNNLVLHYSSNDSHDDNGMLSSQTTTTTTTTKEEQTIMTKKSTFLTTIIINVITTILNRESNLLSNMLLIQQLDIIDGDGAVLIYDRLVYLCNGSYDIADILLDNAAILLPALPTDDNDNSSNNSSITNKKTDTTTAQQQQQCRINASPYTYPDECDCLDELLNVILQFQSLLHEQQQQQEINVTMIDTYHSKCIELVNCLSKEACIYLLTNWLLSSTLCDISFFITFQLLTVNEPPGVDSSNVVNEVRQSCDTGGIALCTPLENHACDDSTTTTTTTTGSAITVPVHYEVKVVDCDPKPARKLRERKHVESKFHLIDEMIW